MKLTYGQWVKYDHTVYKTRQGVPKKREKYAFFRPEAEHVATTGHEKMKEYTMKYGIYLGWIVVPQGKVYYYADEYGGGNLLKPTGGKKLLVVAPEPHKNGMYCAPVRVEYCVPVLDENGDFIIYDRKEPVFPPFERTDHRNMYGVLDCPRCGSGYRYPLQDGKTYCDHCSLVVGTEVDDNAHEEYIRENDSRD